MLETSALETLYNGQITRTNQLIKPNNIYLNLIKSCLITSTFGFTCSSSCSSTPFLSSSGLINITVDVLLTHLTKDLTNGNKNGQTLSFIKRTYFDFLLSLDL